MDQLEFKGSDGSGLAADAFGSPEDPPVLLLPSVGQTRQFWHGAAKALAEAGRYAVCLDLRGHGDSDPAPGGDYTLDLHVADLRAVLAALPSRAAIVASGLGAIVALTAVGESEPHLVSGLAMIDATIWFDPAVSARLKTAFEERGGLFDAPDAVVAAVAAMHPGEPRPAAAEHLLAAFAKGEDGRYSFRGDPRAMLTRDLAESETRLEAAAARLSVPVILIRGALNISVTAEATERLAKLIPGAEAAEVEGSGHLIAGEHQDEFNALLLDFLERRAPRAPLAYIGGAEPRILRDALGCFGTGVTVITSIAPDGKPLGLTANSFTSVSLDPPLILFSLAKSSANLDAFQAAGRFAVNVLHIGQQPVANRFASRAEDRFEGVEWGILSDGGSPIIAHSLASFDCRTYAVHEGGDHLIFIGEVTHAWFEPRRDPLLYFRGKYRRLHFGG